MRTMATALAAGRPESLPNRARGAIGEGDFAGLPDPVVSYFRRALPIGRSAVTAMTIEQEGEILVGNKWKAFTASERLSMNPPEFVWDARISMAPLVKARVRDAHEKGVGSMHASVGRVLTIVHQDGGDSLNTGALYRYLAEAAWMPAALLPRHGVTWTGIDRTRAQATLTNAGATVSVEFTFNADAEITRIFTPARPRAVDGGFEPTPWMGRFSHCEEHAGMRIPMQAEVSWQVGAAWVACWRGRILRVTPDTV